MNFNAVLRQNKCINTHYLLPLVYWLHIRYGSKKTKRYRIKITQVWHVRSVAVNKMAAQKLPPNFLHFSPLKIDSVQRRIVWTLPVHHSYVSMWLFLLISFIWWRFLAHRRTYEKGFYQNPFFWMEGTNLTFSLKIFQIMIPNFSPRRLLISSFFPEILWFLWVYDKRRGT